MPSPHLPARRALLTRLAAATALAGLAVALGATAAAAHVSIQAPDARQGSFTALSVRVPNERDAASTTRLQVVLPANQPIPFVSVKPHPGWTYTVHKAALRAPITMDGEQVTSAVTDITWTATGPDTAIKPGEYDEFTISAGPLPKVTELTFKAIQTYSNGETVRWIEASTPSGAEPEHPAPTLSLAAASAAGGHHQAAAAAPTGNDQVTAGGFTTWLAGVAALLGAIALTLAAGALRRGTTPNAPQPEPAPEPVPAGLPGA